MNTFFIQMLFTNKFIKNNNNNNNNTNNKKFNNKKHGLLERRGMWYSDSNSFNINMQTSCVGVEMTV